MAKKTSLGRQRIEITKIQKKNHLQVTFSKRRSGLFKKASELCTLCGVEIAIIVFSPAGKAFSFGHPNVESIIQKYLDHPSGAAADAHPTSATRELNNQLTQVTSELEAERKKSEAFTNLRSSNAGQFWWEAPVEEMGWEELEQLRHWLSQLKRSVAMAISVQAESFTTTSSATGFGNYLFGNLFEDKASDMLLAAVESTSALTYNYGYGNAFF
uniref:MADS-box domain-containing protein n=1 Tax=Kalanchoe fedtschenkoi TaxID=63787 RepID=A0A7N0TN53_KALFE